MSEAQAEEKKVIRYIYKSQAHWWPPEIDKKIEEEAAKLNVDYQVVGPADGDIGKQVEMIENFVSQKVTWTAGVPMWPPPWAKEFRAACTTSPTASAASRSVSAVRCA